jgi:hypothetical protein
MHSLGGLKCLGFFLRPRVVHLHGLATAGAMLTCAAVVLNVGPFAKAPKIDSLPDSALAEAAQAITEQSLASTSTPRLEIDAPTQPDHLRWAMGPADVPEPIRPSIAQNSASQPATPTQADDEIQAESPRHLAAAVQPPADHENPDLPKKDTIVGVWAPDGGTCSARNFRAGVLAAVINADGAWAGETFCAFKNKKQTETGWRVVAKCSNPRERWTTNVRLTVHDNRLTWTSKRGIQIYTRCAPDVLMAAAR